MSVIKLCKILLLSFSLVFVILFPLTTFAMVATPSDVMKVSVSTSSNASPIDDYVDADEFDTIDSPVLLSSGDDSDYNVKWHYVAVWSGTDTRYTAGSVSYTHLEVVKHRQNLLKKMSSNFTSVKNFYALRT